MSQNLCSAGKKKVALSHFWKGNGRIGKGKTYRQRRAELSCCRQKLGARAESGE